MNKTAINNTTICYWSKDDNSFVAESPLMEIIAGVGKTQQDALRNFKSHLDTVYQSYLEGRLRHIYDKAGRPSKGKVAFNADILPDTKKQLKAVAGKLECTQGELIDFLLFFYQTAAVRTTVEQETGKLNEVIGGIKDDIQKVIEQRLDKIYTHKLRQLPATIKKNGRLKKTA